MEKSIDRLSALPDDILCHILSFLPTTFSVSTSILARRWRFLWARVPILDFDTYDFDSYDQYHQIENFDTRIRFPDFVHKVLFQHKVKSLNTFRLVCDQWDQHPCNDDQLETWITTAIERNVRNLDLRLTLMLPRCLFTCKTLVNLVLYHCVLGIPLTSAVSLPNLNKLHLFYVSYQFNGSLSHLLSGCPVLEELIIDVEQNLGCCNISSPTLKRLTFNISFGYEFYSGDGRLEINTPALKYLQVHDYSCEHASISPMTALVKADISIINMTVDKDYYEDYNTLNRRTSVVEFLDCLRNVKCLKISGCYEKEFLDMNVASSVLSFDNLTKLEVVVDCHFLMKFLESVPNLEVLIIRKVDAHINKYWKEPEQVPTCLSSHLRTIRIGQLGCTEHEFNMLMYFLKHAKVVRRMEIYSQCPALQRISLLERASEACELAFY